MPSTDAPDWGRQCERAAAKKYDLERKPGPGFDLRSPRNGCVYQVKGTDLDRQNPRFRFWLPDHVRLGSRQSCYILVGYRSNARRIERVEKVSKRRVSDSASWGPSGHSKGIQAKVPVRDLL